MFKNLPLEVIETICFFVKVEDLMNVWEVAGMEGSESFWRRICKRQGYKKLTYENSLWKNVFLQNFNWLTQSYVKRKYELKQTITDAQQTGCSQSTELLLGKHLIANRCGEVAHVWDLSSSPNLVQTLPANYISQKRNKLLIYNLSKLEIYSYNTQTFSKLYELPVEFPFHFVKFFSFTEDYLVAVDQKTSCIKIVDLRELTESLIVMPVTISMFFSLILSSKFLFILILEESSYKIKRFNLVDKIWLQDIVLLKCSPLIGVPQLEISSNLIVSWSNQLEATGVTPVKVFSLDGEYLASLLFSSDIESNGTEIIMQIEQILWMIVECDYLIFSTSKTTVSIWSPENLNYVKVIPKEEKLYNGQKVVSNSLLVLSYSYCFKIIDFKKPVYLYEILLDIQNSLDSFEGSNFLVNDYFYVHFQYEEYEDNNKISSDKVLPETWSLCCNCGSKDISKKKSFVHIYDFTGTCST